MKLILQTVLEKKYLEKLCQFVHENQLNTKLRSGKHLKRIKTNLHFSFHKLRFEIQIWQFIKINLLPR